MIKKGKPDIRPRVVFTKPKQTGKMIKKEEPDISVHVAHDECLVLVACLLAWVRVIWREVKLFFQREKEVKKESLRESSQEWMGDTKVETISRLAQWRIENFGPCSFKKSDPFKAGIWNW